MTQIRNRYSKYLLIIACILFASINTTAQVNADKMGAWYMYFYDVKPDKSPIGLQGDVQFRNWDLGGDLEQLLIRSGLTFRPKGDKVKLTLGYGHITSGVYGDSNDTSTESRIYQEAFLPHRLSQRLSLSHRFRYEQRFVDNQDFRTRYRYNLFLTMSINKKEMVKGTYYLSLYNELFINGQKSIGDNRSVEIFDRNRSYIALGLALTEKSKVQLGFMRQTLNSISKGQIQLSLHQNF